jgi:hypothetical protein
MQSDHVATVSAITKETMGRSKSKIGVKSLSFTEDKQYHWVVAAILGGIIGDRSCIEAPRPQGERD